MNIKIWIYVGIALVLAISFIWSLGYILYKRATYSTTTDENKKTKLMTLAELLLIISIISVFAMCFIGIFIDTGTIQ